MKSKSGARRPAADEFWLRCESSVYEALVGCTLIPRHVKLVQNSESSVSRRCFEPALGTMASSATFRGNGQRDQSRTKTKNEETGSDETESEEIKSEENEKSKESENARFKG